MEFKLIEPEEVIYNLIFFDIIGILFLETVFYYFYFIASHDQKLKFREKKRKKERKKVPFSKTVHYNLACLLLYRKCTVSNKVFINSFFL